MAQKRKRNKKWLFWLMMLILVAAAAAVVYMVWDSYFRGKVTPIEDDSETVLVEKQADREQAVEENDKESADEEVVGIEDEMNKVVQYEGENPNQASEISGVVTYARVAGSNLLIRVNIDQFLDSGECELTLKRGQEVVYGNKVSVVDNVSTATCAGFDVPVGQLGNGEIDITINVSAGGRSGVINGRVEI